MKKDVIYIDVEDDITAVIEKLKNSKEKIVALVPPKGNAVLQSVVNLKLLKRAAKNAGKQPVIVTNNQALKALAGGADLYVAKNLQSKPVLAGEALGDDIHDETVEVSDEDEDEAGVDDTGTTVSLASDESAAEDASSDSDEVELSGEELAALEAENAGAKNTKGAKDKKEKSKKVPNFDSFRKKLLIGGGIALALLVVLFFVFGRSKANIVIRAETTPVEVAFDANFNANTQQSDPATYNLKANYQESKKTISQTFAATGQKDLGTKASGSMTLSIQCSAVTSFPTVVPAGTGVSANGLTFITESAATLSSPGGGGGGCRFSGSTTVTAQNNGDQYNLSARSYTVSGFSSVTGNGGQMSGGTSKVVKVVSQDDVNKAKEQINQQDTSQVKEELKKGFGENVTVLDDTFTTTLGNIVSEPAVGQEANEGKLTVEATYSMLAAPNEDLSAALDAFVTSKMTDKDNQRVYDNGFKNMKLEKVSNTNKTAVYKITTLAQYGPQFDTEKLKNEVAGKKFGEARSYLQDLPGVKGVDIKLTPFWARKLPKAENVQIKLEVDENTSGQ